MRDVYVSKVEPSANRLGCTAGHTWTAESADLIKTSSPRRTYFPREDTPFSYSLHGSEGTRWAFRIRHSAQCPLAFFHDEMRNCLTCNRISQFRRNMPGISARNNFDESFYLRNLRNNGDRAALLLLRKIPVRARARACFTRCQNSVSLLAGTEETAVTHGTV